MRLPLSAILNEELAYFERVSRESYVESLNWSVAKCYEEIKKLYDNTTLTNVEKSAFKVVNVTAQLVEFWIPDSYFKAFDNELAVRRLFVRVDALAPEFVASLKF